MIGGQFNRGPRGRLATRGPSAMRTRHPRFRGAGSETRAWLQRGL